MNGPEHDVVVRARDVSRRFVARHGASAHTALDALSFEVSRGSLVAFVGPDGAGKTTLIRMMCGLLEPSSGRLEILGFDVAKDPQAVQDRVSYMPQRFGLYEDMSVQENLDLYADLHGVPRDERRSRFSRLMDMTDLGRFTGRLAGKLSGGMKQKLGLACTLVRTPELLLLDEPTVGVDPLSRRELWEIVQSLMREERITVVMSTAYMDEAEKCGEVHLLREGHCLAAGTPGSISAKADGLCFVARPPRDQPPRLLQAALLDDTEHVIDAVPAGSDVRYILRPGAAGQPPILGGATQHSVPPRLEDGFMRLVREAAGFQGSHPFNAQAPSRATHPPGAVIEVKHVVRRFGDFVAVADTSFDVERGEVFGLLGPNGAGKTTTFRMLCGLLPASSGTLRVAGVDLRTARASARQRVGYMSQKFSLYGNLTVLENLGFFAGAYGLRGEDASRRIASSLSDFELEGVEHERSESLPGGFKQRLAMAAALIHEPEILFLDEPTSGADPIARREFWRRITALAQAGTTVVVTTHFMEEAEYCDRIAIQDAGRILALGTPAGIRRQTGTEAMEDAFIEVVKTSRAEAARGAKAA